MNTLGLVLIMGGALLIWAGLTDNSIIELVKGITGKGDKKVKPSKPTNQNPGRPLPRPVQQK
jgi:hypothetical protein